jgi:3D (Asp-Asp-Asp) domain-containing protein
MYSYDHDLATFVAIGSATVSADGATITSDPGSGVIKAGWHCGGNPNQMGSAGSCQECQKCDGSACAADTSRNGTSCTLSEGKCARCADGNCIAIQPTLSVARVRLTETSAIGAPRPGANPSYIYTAKALDGSNIASYAATDPNVTPNLARIIAPRNPSAEPNPGGLAEMKVAFECRAGDRVIKTFNAATFGLSCYVLAAETDFLNLMGQCISFRFYGVSYSGITVDPDGLPAGSYCTAFLEDVRLQGSGSTRDGTLIKWSRGARPNWVFRTITHFTGADNKALITFETCARDRAIIPRNTSIEVQSYSLDANDTGEKIVGYRLDVFGGPGRMSCANFINRIEVGACSPASARCPNLSSP